MQIRIPGVFWVSLITALIAVLEMYSTSDWMPPWVPALIILLGAVAKLVELYVVPLDDAKTMTRGSFQPRQRAFSLAHFFFD